jgi:hypothetical protein
VTTNTGFATGERSAEVLAAASGVTPITGNAAGLTLRSGGLDRPGRAAPSLGEWQLGGAVAVVSLADGHARGRGSTRHSVEAGVALAVGVAGGAFVLLPEKPDGGAAGRKNRDGGALIVRGAVFRDLIDSVKHGSFDS